MSQGRRGNIPIKTQNFPILTIVNLREKNSKSYICDNMVIIFNLREFSRKCITLISVILNSKYYPPPSAPFFTFFLLPTIALIRCPRFDSGLKICLVGKTLVISFENCVFFVLLEHEKFFKLFGPMT